MRTLLGRMRGLLENLLCGSMTAFLVPRLHLKSVCLAPQLLMTGFQGPLLKNVPLVLCRRHLLLKGLSGLHPLMTAVLCWRSPFVPRYQAFPTAHHVLTIVAVQ